MSSVYCISSDLKFGTFFKKKKMKNFFLGNFFNSNILDPRLLEYNFLFIIFSNNKIFN